MYRDRFFQNFDPGGHLEILQDALEENFKKERKKKEKKEIK